MDGAGAEESASGPAVVVVSCRGTPTQTSKSVCLIRIWPFRSQGRCWGQEILGLEDVPAPKWVAEWFDIEPDTTVFVRRRRNWVDDEPTQVADSYYRLETVADTAIRNEDTGPGGSYARLEERGLRLERLREEIAIRMPSPDET